MMDFPTLNTFLNGFGHLSKSHSSIQPKVVSSLVESLPGGSSVPSRTPIHNASVRLLHMSQKKEAHLRVCSPWGRAGRAGEGAVAGTSRARLCPDLQQVGRGTGHCLALPILPAASHHLEALDCVLSA